MAINRKGNDKQVKGRPPLALPFHLLEMFDHNESMPPGDPMALEPEVKSMFAFHRTVALGPSPELFYCSNVARRSSQGISSHATVSCLLICLL